MQYSPKLKKAAEEIKAILKKYDIGALVVLHNPGHIEYIVEISPSYSCAKIEPYGVRVKAKLQEDFNGDKEKWETTIWATTNMLNSLGQIGAKQASILMQVSKEVDKVTNATHTNDGHTSHEQQNN